MARGTVQQKDASYEYISQAGAWGMTFAMCSFFKLEVESREHKKAGLRLQKEFLGTKIPDFQKVRTHTVRS